MYEVVVKVLLDQLALVAASYQEVLASIVDINIHDVPQDRLPAYFHHWLRTVTRLFGKAGTPATCKNHDMHNLNHRYFRNRDNELTATITIVPLLTHDLFSKIPCEDQYIIRLSFQQCGYRKYRDVHSRCIETDFHRVLVHRIRKQLSSDAAIVQ